MRSTKKLLSLLVIALLCVGLVATAAFAADGDELPPVPVTPNVVASGTCGENLTWVYDSAGNLVISGTGALEFDGDSPWSDFTDDVKTITIGEGVTSLCSYAFTNFHAIKTLALPDTMQTIGDGIIASCNSLMTFEVSANNPYLSVDEQGVLFNKDKTVLLCMPGGIQGDYQVPAGVTRIEAYAFYSCCYIDSITLPGSVTEIGRSAFQSSNMKNLTLSEGLLSIESYAIANCTCLTEIALPSSLEEIGEWAFSGSAIYSVQIPADTTSIGIGAFGNCLNLTDILVDSENISFSNDYHGALFNKDMTTLIAFPGGINGHYPVPDTVTLIGKYAFSYGRIDGVYLQEGVTKIDEYAFDRCSKMTFIELPESLEYIGYQAFGYCGLTEIVIPENVTDLRSYAFIACTDLARITFKGSVPFIDSDTFQDVTADVYFPIGNTSWSQDVLTDYGGNLTWIPDQAPIRLEISDKPLVCLKDSTPDLSNVSVLAVYEGDVKITIPSRLLELGTCDVSTVGLKTLTVSYSGCSADIKVAVHDGTSAEPDVYPESSHPYNDYCDEEQIITIPGAQYISLTFSQDTYTEQGWDYIYLYDGYGEPIGTYSGDEAAGLTVTVPGDTVKIAFYSDGSNTYYGYSFSSIVGVDIIHPGDPAEDKAPTCSDPGYSGGIFCQICQDRVNHTVIPALGHEYEAVITPPTPEANGYTTHTCIRCGDNYTDSITIYGQIASGACGEDGWWALSDSGVLTISGTGPMGDYDGDGKSFDDEIAPWHNYLTDIHHVVIKDGITNISSHAFDGCTNLSSIEIPDSVTSIARCAFWDCTNLKTIEIPDSVVSIGEYAFSGCTNLISVNIPNGVTEILDGVFRYCDSLSEIRIPASVQQIDIWALRYCGNLNAIWVDEANEYYSSDASGVLFNKNKSNLIMAPTMLSGTYTVPESVVIICGRSFYGCSDLAAINLPEGLEEIWPYAFAYCGDLDKIEIPDNTYLIGENIFAGCTALAEVKLPKIGVRIDESTFENCVNLVSIEIPEGFTGIADNAFYGCINLETITLPITLKYVSTNVFYCCDNLTDVYYAGKPADWDNLEIYDGNGALTNATLHCSIISGTCGDNLTWVLSEEGVLTVSGEGAMYDSAPWEDYRNLIVGIVIEEGVTKIGAGAFAYCSEVTSVQLASTVEIIGAQAFYDTHLLDEIRIPASMTEIGTEAFMYSSAIIQVDAGNPNFSNDEYGVLFDKNQTVLMSVPHYLGDSYLVPESVKVIAESAFYGRSNLTEIILPDGLERIESKAFIDCDALIKIEIPSTVTEIFAGAFRGCDNLSEVVIGEGIDTIEGSLFEFCENLTTVTIPATVQSIKAAAFYSCGSLTDVYFQGNAAQWGAIQDGGDNEWLFNAKLHFGDLSGTCGENATWVLTEDGTLTISGTGIIETDWSQSIRDQIVNVIIETGITSIGDYAFSYCCDMHTVQIPDTVTGIGAYAFEQCCELESIEIPEAVTDIGAGAFSGCEELTSVVIPDGIPAIGDSTFSQCYNLESVVIPDSVTEIGDRAFCECYGLTSVEIPDDVTRIGESAFRSCTSLTSIVIPEGVDTIGWGAFIGCDGLTSVVIPGSVVSFGNSAFSGCSGLTSVVISEGASCISGSAFSMCENLTSVVIPESMTYIGWEAFMECPKLESIVIPAGVTFIDEFTFTDCTGLTTITLPANMDAIADCAFKGCTGLTDVYYQGKREEWNTIQIGKSNECLTNATIHFPSLATPEVTSLSNTSQGVKLTWNAVEGASLYEIYILRNGEWEAVGQSSDTSFTYLSSVSGEHYTFTVRCISNYLKPESEFNPDGWSITYVAQPSISKLENTSTGIKLTWKAVPGAAKYRIYVKSGNSGWKAVTAVSGTSYTFTNVTSGTSYTFTVRCVDADNKVATSSYSNTGWKKTFVAQPSISKLENTSTGIKLTWNAVNGAAGYKIYIKSGSTWKVLTTVTGTSYTYTAAKSGTAYRFTIRCVDANGNAVSAYNNTGWSQTYIAQPSISKLENTSAGIKLTWNAVNGAAGYKIYIKSGSTWKVLTTVTGTSYTYTAAKSGTAYRFTIRCVDANGNAISSYNNTGWRTTYVGEAAISKFENTASGIKLTWNAVNGAAGYKIYIKTSSGWKILATVTGTSYTYTAAKSGTAYRFTIRCVDANGNAISSYNATGWRKTFIGQPTMTGVKKASSGMTVSWNAVSGATRYKVYVKTSSGWKALGTVTGTSFTYTAAKKGTNYRFTVRCVDANGNAVSAYNTTGWVFKCP